MIENYEQRELMEMTSSNRSSLTVESLPPLKPKTISSVLHKIVKARKWTAFSHHPSFKALSLPVISCYVAIIIWSNSHIKPTDLQAFSTYCDQVRIFRFRKLNAKVIPMNLTLMRHIQSFPSSLRWWSILKPLTSFSAFVTADLLANACHSQKRRESQKQRQYPC